MNSTPPPLVQIARGDRTVLPQAQNLKIVKCYNLHCDSTLGHEGQIKLYMSTFPIFCDPKIFLLKCACRRRWAERVSKAK